MSDADILGQGSVVNRGPEGEGVEPLTAMEEAEAEEALARARDAFLRGEYAACLEIARATLEKGPPPAVASELRSLRFEAKRRQLSQDVLSARVLPVREVCVMGSEAVLELTLLNLAKQPVEVARRARGSSDAVFVLSVTREDLDVYGNVRTETTTHRVPLGEDLEVPVGGRRSVEHALPTPRPEDRHLGFTVLRIGGILRPALIRCGEARYYSGVELGEAVVRVFPPGYEPIAEDPLGTLDKAYRLGAREHLLVAAELAPPERRHETVAKLVSYLEGAETGTWVTVIAALRRLTGRSFTGQPRAWIEWWKEEGRNELF
ncbi:MAG: hypothetical protein ACYS99_13755 [Planctomycetota bacterium]